MIPSSTPSDAKTLLRDGRSDEEVERLTGVSLGAIVVMRAEAASAPVAADAGQVFRRPVPFQVTRRGQGEDRSPA